MTLSCHDGDQHLAPVVQRLGNAVHHINHYPVNKCQENNPRYRLDSDLSGGQRYPPFEQPGPGVDFKMSGNTG